MDNKFSKHVKEEIIIASSDANKKALLLMFPLVVVAFTPYWLLWKNQFTVAYLKTLAEQSKLLGAWATILLLGIIVMGIILHELIHGITWSTSAPSRWKSISFGVIWKELTPYCHCKEPLRVKKYLIGAAMPAIVLGAVPTILAYLSGNLFLLLFGVFFTAAAAGDFMLILLLMKEDRDNFVQDHPDEIGFIIYRKIKE